MRLFANTSSVQPPLRDRLNPHQQQHFPLSPAPLLRCILLLRHYVGPLWSIAYMLQETPSREEKGPFRHSSRKNAVNRAAQALRCNLELEWCSRSAEQRDMCSKPHSQRPVSAPSLLRANGFMFPLVKLHASLCSQQLPHPPQHTPAFLVRPYAVPCATAPPRDRTTASRSSTA